MDDVELERAYVPLVAVLAPGAGVAVQQSTYGTSRRPSVSAFLVLESWDLRMLDSSRTTATKALRSKCWSIS
jgi:hypothetical protein